MDKPGPKRMAAPWHYPFKKAFRIGCFLLSHLIVACLLIAMIEVVDWALHVDGKEKLLFDVFPLKYLFQAMEVGIIFLLTVSVVKDAWEIAKETHDG